MTKEGKPKERSIEDLFDEAEIISVYSDREAVEDGILVPVKELGKVDPVVARSEHLFEYLTSNLCYSKGYFLEGVPVQPGHFIDLFKAIGEVMAVMPPDHFYTAKVDFPDGTRGEVYAVKNNSGKYTIMLSEDY
jgi:hypothetical protein